MPWNVDDYSADQKIFLHFMKPEGLAKPTLGPDSKALESNTFRFSKDPLSYYPPIYA
jgi:hypothetical protein